MKSTAPESSASPKRPWFPAIVVAIFAVWLLAGLRVPPSGESFDVNAFGKLPALVGGRVKPMDTVARNSLLIIRGRQSIGDTAGRTLEPGEWLMDVLLKPGRADQYKTFVINNPDVLGLFGWKQEHDKYFSFAQLQPHLETIQKQAEQVEGVDEKLRNPFQKEVVKLRDHVLLYNRLKSSIHGVGSVTLAEELDTYKSVIEPGIAAAQASQAGKPFDEKALALLGDFFKRYDFVAHIAYISPVPRADWQQWKNIGQSLLETMKDGKIDPSVTAYSEMESAYRAGDAQAFNATLTGYRKLLGGAFPALMKKIDFEFFFNHFEPFYKAIVLYVCVFLLALISWLKWPESLGRAALWLLILTFVVHTFGLVARMWMQGRPPVTNLYSSAIFVGWGACLLCIVLEKIHRNGIGSLTAATMGFLTLIIAHNLAGDGDTMEMLRAVLDTNIWLATHVVCVTIGYSATFLAGFLALLYIVRGLFTASLDTATAKSLGKMVYGIVCFAMLFSFVGTILGGIWADQSWGRFWGFDPKENGALLIVLWNAMILHARWGGFIRERGLMNMAVFGNIVTSFSWFGVNMLGIGLHSYGFMESAMWWLGAFMASQIAFIALGMLPLRMWRSFSKKSPSRRDGEVLTPA